MKFYVQKIVSFLLLLLPLLLQSKSNAFGNPNSFDKGNFYAAMSSQNIATVNEQLSILKTATLNIKTAYEGALLMKKASLVGNPKEKINLFKAGRRKLEGQILKDDDNAEFRFLRLIIQEHAPKIVNYRNSLEKDSQIIIQQFNKLPNALQEVITDYSKTSKILHQKDFN